MAEWVFTPLKPPTQRKKTLEESRKLEASIFCWEFFLLLNRFLFGSFWGGGQEFAKSKKHPGKGHQKSVGAKREGLFAEILEDMI